MPLPRILLVVPLLFAGAFLPAFGPEPDAPPAGALGMSHYDYTSESVTVQVGDTLTLANNSRWAHTVGAGRGGSVRDAAGVPLTGFTLMQTNDIVTTGRWNTPGTFYLTCSVHPDMTVKVVVAN
ncbi:MAG: cupredoxin domain-containing protein [Geodermatophilaceae bacterium]